MYMPQYSAPMLQGGYYGNSNGTAGGYAGPYSTPLGSAMGANPYLSSKPVTIAQPAAAAVAAGNLPIYSSGYQPPSSRDPFVSNAPVPTLGANGFQDPSGALFSTNYGGRPLEVYQHQQAQPQQQAQVQSSKAQGQEFTGWSNGFGQRPGVSPEYGFINAPQSAMPSRQGPATMQNTAAAYGAMPPQPAQAKAHGNQHQKNPPTGAVNGLTAPPQADDDDDPNRLPTFVKVRGLPADHDPRIARRPRAKKRQQTVCCA